MGFLLRAQPELPCQFGISTFDDYCCMCKRSLLAPRIVMVEHTTLTASLFRLAVHPPLCHKMDFDEFFLRRSCRLYRSFSLATRTVFVLGLMALKGPPPNDFIPSSLFPKSIRGIQLVDKSLSSTSSARSAGATAIRRCTSRYCHLFQLPPNPSR